MCLSSSESSSLVGDGPEYNKLRAEPIIDAPISCLGSSMLCRYAFKVISPSIPVFTPLHL